MSEAFKCDYCKQLFEGRPADQAPNWPLAKGRLRHDVGLELRKDVFHLRDSGFVPYIRDQRADLCQDCYGKLERYYYGMIREREQSKGSDDV